VGNFSIGTKRLITGGLIIMALNALWLDPVTGKELALVVSAGLLGLLKDDD
jgi:hypothetical protein